ncbi:COMM domain-containing protein 5 isoform X2 [Pteropus medius]|uniref:COMM domain-containing protein 5 isoform X2 n=1 Tax=Pteropus vampyrus TaxID=132908 RepID=UPI00196B4B33|nr:COMM domain-containing protein 5 isoform X2 [Pteropus giganteus]
MWLRVGEAERLKVQPQACRPCHPFVPGVLGRHPISSHPHSPKSLPGGLLSALRPRGLPGPANSGRPELQTQPAASPASPGRSGPARSPPGDRERARARTPGSTGPAGRGRSQTEGAVPVEGAGPGGTRPAELRRSRGAPPCTRTGPRDLRAGNGSAVQLPHFLGCSRTTEDSRRLWSTRVSTCCKSNLDMSGFQTMPFSCKVDTS